MSYIPTQADFGMAQQVLASGSMLDHENKLNVNGRRFFVDPADGKSYILVQNGRGSDGKPKYGKVQVNATALLRYDEWKDIDRTVIEAATLRMVGLSDLRARGLVHNLGSIGQTISLWESQSDMTEADISMSAITRGEKDTPAYDTQQVPVPIVHKDFSVELRRLTASRAFGASIDVTAASIAGRVVAERSEKMLFLGAPVKVNGATIYGYLTHPNRNTIDLAENWDLAATTGADILDDVQQMLAASRADKHYGPWVLYIPGTYEGRMGDDYRDQDNRTIRQRILDLGSILEIKVADFLPANNVVLVQMTPDVVDLAIAQDITTVQWSIMGGMQEEFKVMAVWVPRIKADFSGNSGIVHLRPA